jgi:hypothetical protein
MSDFPSVVRFMGASLTSIDRQEKRKRKRKQTKSKNKDFHHSQTRQGSKQPRNNQHPSHPFQLGRQSSGDPN